MSQLSTTDRQAIDRFARSVRQTFHGRVQSIQLFGSKARGDATADSDVDVLVVLTDMDWRDRKEVSRLASHVFGQTDVLLSPSVYTVDQINQMKRHRNMFWQSIEPDLTSL